MKYCELHRSHFDLAVLCYIASMSRQSVNSLFSHERCGQKHLTSSQGFTFVELLIAITVVLVAVAGSAAAFNFAIQSTSRSSDRVKIDALIEADIASLNTAANNYTYCTGSYTWDGRVCGSATPGQQSYYFPPASSGNTVNAEKFAEDCEDGDMVDSLVSAIAGSDSALDLSQAAVDQGLSRAVAQEGSSHLIKLTYSLNSTAYRVVALVPLAAGWCP